MGAVPREIWPASFLVAHIEKCPVWGFVALFLFEQAGRKANLRLSKF